MAVPDFEYTGKNKHFRYVRLGELGIIVWSRVKEMSDADFSEHCDCIAAANDKLGAATVVITYAAVFTPSTRQRAIVKDQSARIGIPSLRRVVLVTPSALIRGAVSAITWIMRERYDTRPFSPNDLPAALDAAAEVVKLDRATVESELRRSIESVGG